VGPWSKLLRSDAEQLEIELRKVGLELADLVDDAQEEPRLQTEGFDRLSPEAQQRRAVEWYGDQGHALPRTTRRRWINPFGTIHGSGPFPESETYETPQYLPRLEDETEADEVEPDLSGRPLPALPALEAIKLFGEGATAYHVDQETTLSYRGVLRVETWVRSGAVWWDAITKRPGVAKDFRLEVTGEGDAATVQLVRA
jgi:hypothetical protein